MSQQQQQAMNKMFQEVETKYYQTQQELQQVKSQIANREREIKISNATLDQLDKQKVDTVWQGVGRMFMNVSMDTYVANIKTDQKALQESITALGKKQHYLDTTLKNTTDAINEMMKQSK